MKEKIRKILTVDHGVVYGDFPGLIADLETLFNQEVEKRIKERMPSEMTFEKAEIAAKETDYACFAVEPEGNEINFADAAAFYLEGWNACRSRLLLTQDQKKDKQQVDN